MLLSYAVLMPWLCRAYAVAYLLFIRTNYMDILRMKHQIAPEMPSTFDRRKCKKMGKKNRNTSTSNMLRFRKYSRWESNPHSRKNRILNPARLPIPPLEQSRLQN